MSSLCGPIALVVVVMMTMMMMRLRVRVRAGRRIVGLQDSRWR
jgi:hypothetical protein